MKKANTNWNRPGKFEHYLNTAKTAAERSTCLRRRVGAIIVKNDVVISSGYSGAPRGMENCCDIKKCFREDLGVPSGERYELCRAIHAEQNAIINAARIGISIIDGEMYISSERRTSGYNKSNKKSKGIYGPCLMCKKEIINAGLRAVHMSEEGIGEKTYTKEVIENSLKEEEKEIRRNLKKTGSR